MCLGIDMWAKDRKVMLEEVRKKELEVAVKLKPQLLGESVRSKVRYSKMSRERVSSDLLHVHL